MDYGRGMGGGFGRGYGRGMGFAFRGSSPGGPYVGIGRGGLPRCAAYAGSYPASGMNYPRLPKPGWRFRGRSFSPEEEVNVLRERETMLRREIEAVEARIKEMEGEKSPGGER